MDLRYMTPPPPPTNPLKRDRQIQVGNKLYETMSQTIFS